MAEGCKGSRWSALNNDEASGTGFSLFAFEFSSVGKIQNQTGLKLVPLADNWDFFLNHFSGDAKDLKDKGFSPRVLLNVTSHKLEIRYDGAACNSR
ncbi:MAG: hypothetical protein ABSA96_05490 [Candidatus Acidiferrales bacterium]|jgi:hypothetical protein